MKTYHIHIKGLVQGVGFRPHVYHKAENAGITGWVSNTKDGVHIEFNAEENTAQEFYSEIIRVTPPNAIITSHSIREVNKKTFNSFSITTGGGNMQSDLLLTPDFAICDECKKEIMNSTDRRNHYPFTTCLHCGPRYSIIKELPYERTNTAMAEMYMCNDCLNEYQDVHNRRHYSQTNSCKSCSIQMHLYESGGREISNDSTEILKKINEALHEGAVAAVKGIGGYLLLCDATNENAINTLRHRKNRPVKPFALLYTDTVSANADVYISAEEENALHDRSAPIVLCRLKQVQQTGICTETIAPGLDKIGLMLPCSPLLLLIISAFKKPLVATSANVSGSPIIYKDEDALELLPAFADLILSYDRDIVIPEDDSVIQISKTGINIILRRSKGLAPNYFPNPFTNIKECTLAMGAELKSAFAIHTPENLYVSQYLGNQENLESQDAFTQTAGHLLKLLQVKPAMILADKHPGYFVSQSAKEISLEQNLPLLEVQHHKAHFGAVLAENGLLGSTEPILGVTWDGAGYGDDKQVWGGEFFVYENNDIQRLAHIDYYPQLLGDKMNREPRLSALSLLKNFPAKQSVIRTHFSDTEWKYYEQLIEQPPVLLTSSMGRLIDAIASLTGACQINTFEGEAAMKLEAMARSCELPMHEYYPVPQNNNRLDLSLLLQEVLNDIDNHAGQEFIAKKFFYSLARLIGQVSNHYEIDEIAFSGGVFQNALLTDMVNELYSKKKKLYWHRQLSPNDECIGFGQLAVYDLLKQNENQNSFNTDLLKLPETNFNF